MFSLELPHRGESNEYTQTIFNIKKENHLNKLQLWDFSKGLKNEFKTAMEHEPLVFESLK